MPQGSRAGRGSGFALSKGTDIKSSNLMEMLMDRQFAVRNVGEGSWVASPFKTWVSKTDITQFLRCKYRVFILHSRNLPLEEVRDTTLIAALLEKGRQFEGNVISQMPFEEAASIESVMDRELILRTLELIQNHELGIRGVVDLVEIEKGKLYPIEIKAHKRVTKADRLELAFYWRLLEPLRKGEPEPKGYILLNTGEAAEVLLTNRDLDELDSLISEIRYVREVGTEPVIRSECEVCGLHDECLPLLSRRGDLTLLHGISEVRKKELDSLEITSISALSGADAADLRQKWRELTPYAPGISEIERMQIHAKSWIERRPIYFGCSSFDLLDKVAILDLEYDSFIWLVGFLVPDTEAPRCYQFFAEKRAQEKQILLRLVDLVEKYPTCQILTWDGIRADMPHLEAAWDRHELPGEKLQTLKRRHSDLYQLFLHSYRFPSKSFSLKTVEKHFGFRRKHKDMDGLLALALYNQYLDIPKSDEKRAKIKQKLLEYNRDDLEATLHVLSQLRLLGNERQ